MFVNKLLPSVQPSLKFVRGNISQRDKNSKELTYKIFEHILNNFNDKRAIVPYSGLQKDIYDIFPDKNFRFIIIPLDTKKNPECDGLCSGVTDSMKRINSIAIKMKGVLNSIKSYHLPVFIHEFQHAADNFYNPKYISRSQKLIKKGLDNEKYKNFFDDYYYCKEYAKSRKKRRFVLKIIKEETLKFLKDFNIEDRIDYLQDMRYCLMSERNAYMTQRKISYEMQSKGLRIHPYNFENYPKIGLFEEKIKLLKRLTLDFVTQERHKIANNRK